MTSRNLVLATLNRLPSPRPPVVCPGGMMSFAVTEAMAQTGHWWPAAHSDPVAMAALAIAMQRETGIDTVSVPFCMTVEAEALGAEVNYGTPTVQPRIAREPLATIDDVDRLIDLPPPAIDRRPVVLEAIRRIRPELPNVALVGSVVGPVSLACQLLETSLVLRAMRRKPAAVHALLRLATDTVRDFALDQLRAGADLITIADPTATGEILGAALFSEFADPYLRELIAAIHAAGAPVILHICGNLRTLLPALSAMPAEALSVDETVNLRDVRSALTTTRLMGNISGDLLATGTPESISNNARRVLATGVDILAPACGVLPSTPLTNLRALAGGAARVTPATEGLHE